MENMTNKTKVFLLDGERCPECGEKLAPADLEMYPRCPYCDHQFPPGPQLEEFILKPTLLRWMTNACQQFPR